MLLALSLTLRWLRMGKPGTACYQHLRVVLKYLYWYCMVSEIEPYLADRSKFHRAAGRASASARRPMAAHHGQLQLDVVDGYFRTVAAARHGRKLDGTCTRPPCARRAQQQALLLDSHRRLRQCACPHGVRRAEH